MTTRHANGMESLLTLISQSGNQSRSQFMDERQVTYVSPQQTS